MQGKKSHQEKLFINFQLSSHVPVDNFYRRLSEQLDLKFLYQLTAPYYGTEGQKSIDPVVFMKLMLVGYFENISSDRHIIAVSRLRLDILYFIGYDLEDELPWHSTLSRTRQLYGVDVFTEFFKRVLKQCVNKGMVAGKRQAVDGFFIKANASMDSLIEREILDDAAIYGSELKANEEKEQIAILPVDKQKCKDKNGLKTKEKLPNDAYYSPTDPDAKISVKPGKPTALNYLGQVSVDTATHVITHIQAFTADKRDSECLPGVLVHLKNNLLENGIVLEELIADTGFSSADALKALQANRITAYIPNRGQFKPERENFTYHASADYYQCTQGVKVQYRGTYLTAGYWMKLYTAGVKGCVNCPLKDGCAAYKSKSKKVLIKETIDKPYYDIMHERMKTGKAKIMMKLRQSTVEPVIGTLTNYLGIRRVNAKGLSQANKCVTMAAIAYNLKKMLKYTPRLIKENIQKLKNDLIRLFCAILYSLRAESLVTIS